MVRGWPFPPASLEYTWEMVRGWPFPPACLEYTWEMVRGWPVPFPPASLNPQLSLLSSLERVTVTRSLPIWNYKLLTVLRIGLGSWSTLTTMLMPLFIYEKFHYVFIPFWENSYPAFLLFAMKSFLIVPRQISNTLNRQNRFPFLFLGF